MAKIDDGRLVEFLMKSILFLGLTPDGDPSPGCRSLAIPSR